VPASSVAAVGALTPRPVAVDPAAAAHARALLAAASKQGASLGFGGPGHSNAIALAGRLTRSGQPLLLGGPQLGYSLPQTFMELGLHGAGFDATGVTLPGVPGVLIGAGFDHAWTVTTGGDDNQDLYVETTDPAGHPGKYLFDGHWRAYDCRTETIEVAGAGPASFPACDSVHGPVLGQSGTTAIALRDATRPHFQDTLLAFMGIDRAQNLAQFLQAAQQVGGSLNLTYADSRGHIAYAHVGPVPIRPASDNRFLPHPGDGSDEWLGFVPRSALPLVVDPTRGWVANWNNKPEQGWRNSSDGFWQWGPVQRVQVLTRQLDRIAPRTATMDTLERINRTAGQTAETPPGNPDAPLVQALLGPMLARVDTAANPRLAGVVARMRAWDQLRVDRNGDGSYDSPSVTVFTAWYRAFVASVIVPELGPAYAADGFEASTTANVVSRLLSGARAALPLQLGYLHGTSVRAALSTSLASALDTLTASYGTSDVGRWLTPDLTITWSPLGAGSVPQTPWMNRGTYNQIVSLDRSGPRGENVVAPGESGDVRDPHFADQLNLYATWQYKPMRLTRASVAAHASGVEVLTF
jgi:penicillin amidase